MITTKEFLDEVNGRVIGHTTSGKKVWDTFSNPNHSSFGRDDHTDAMIIHAYLHFKKKRPGSEVEGKKHEKATVNKRGKITREFDNKFNIEQGHKIVHKDFR